MTRARTSTPEGQFLPAQTRHESLPLPRPRPIHVRVLILAAIFGSLGSLLLSNAPLCPVAATVHHPCPGCGLTRATFAAAHFDFGRAWELHPFAFGMSPLLFLSAMFASVTYLKDGDARLPKWFRPVFTRGGLALILLMVPFWIARFYGLHGGPVPTP